MAPSIGSDLLLPLSWVYGAGIGLRNMCFDRHLFRSGSVEVPVVSVGNISAGGTGKTPMVEYLVKYFRKRGTNVAVLSRGYGRSTSGTRVVSDGRSVLGTPAESGDEPFQIAMNSPDTVVLVDEDRLRGGRELVSRFRPAMIVLDDGFQHRWLERACDIVLVDGGELLRSERLLPAGHLREPLRALRRATCVVLTNSAGHAAEAMRKIADVTERAAVRAELEAVQFVSGDRSRQAALGELSPRTCIAFCGIARPENFRATVEGLGFEVRAFQPYPDHHQYRDGDLASLSRAYGESGARWILTTEKDAMRLHGRPMPAAFPAGAWFYVRVEMRILDGAEHFSDLLDGQMRSAA